MKIVVIGGSGVLGARLVTELGARGHQTVLASPDTGVNTLTGEGLADALRGAAVVVDVSNAPLDASTRNLLASEAAAGVGHHVALGVVGTAHEALIKQSSIPYSIVRATQFSNGVASELSRIAVGSPVNGIVDAHS
jgi:uncharacterized protein YbjT (DUF2867 family)